jgi:hypothetical protein
MLAVLCYKSQQTLLKRAQETFNTFRCSYSQNLLKSELTVTYSQSALSACHLRKKGLLKKEQFYLKVAQLSFWVKY